MDKRDGGVSIFCFRKVRMKLYLNNNYSHLYIRFAHENHTVGPFLCVYLIRLMQNRTMFYDRIVRGDAHLRIVAELIWWNRMYRDSCGKCVLGVFRCWWHSFGPSWSMFAFNIQLHSHIIFHILWNLCIGETEIRNRGTQSCTRCRTSYIVIVLI